MARQALPHSTPLHERYRIDTVLGAGGFGITYDGQDTHLDRRVAIKEYFPTDHADREGHYTVRPNNNSQFFDQGRTWFLREARTLARYHHPNIVGVMDHFEENNTAYMVLRYEDGQSLSRWIRSLGRPPTQAEIDGFLLPILSALETMHRDGDLHRDVAMDNIIVRPNGEPVLIDFGSARQLIGQHSRTIDAVVKTGYSPPEQYSVEGKHQGPWSDIYALAATLYLAITNKLPPDAPGRGLDDTYQPLANADLQGYRIGLLEGIDWGLALSPRDRPQTISDWRRTLLKTGDDPLDEDPVELLPQSGQSKRQSSGRPLGASTGGLRTPLQTSLPRGATAAPNGTVVVDHTGRPGSRATGRATGPGRPASTPRGRTATAPGRPQQTNAAPSALRSQPREALSPESSAEEFVDEAATDDGYAPPMGFAGIEWALLALAGVFAFLVHRFSGFVMEPIPGTAPGSDGQLPLVIKGIASGWFPVSVACVGLTLGSLVGRSLTEGHPAVARQRAMLALGLATLIPLVGVLLLGVAALMWHSQRQWHITVLNIVGSASIGIGVIALVVFLPGSPIAMLVLASFLTLIGLGFLALLAARSPVQSNSHADR